MRRHAWVGVVVFAALAACGLFPSLDGLTSEDAAVDGAVPTSDGGPTFIQQTATSFAAPNTVVLPAALTPGSTTLVLVSFPSYMGSVQVTDTLNRAFSVVATVDGTGNFSTWRQVMFAAFGGPGGLDTFTVTTSSTTVPDGSANYLEVWVEEYAGASSVDVKATSSGVFDASTGDVYVPWDAGAVTTTRPNDMLVVFVESAGGARLDPSFTTRSTFHGNAVGDLAAGVPGSYPVSGVANNSWASISAALSGP